MYLPAKQQRKSLNDIENILTCILSNKLMTQKQSYTLYKEQNTNLVKKNINVLFVLSVMGMSSHIYYHILLLVEAQIFLQVFVHCQMIEKEAVGFLLLPPPCPSAAVKSSTANWKWWQKKLHIFGNINLQCSSYQCNRDCILLVRHRTIWWGLVSNSEC